MTTGAIRTDFILSAEIMVIALNEVADESVRVRALILVVVAIVITVLVYGVVALIVKMDDIGLQPGTKRRAASPAFGAAARQGHAQPCWARSPVVGTVAMLWVGGHIMLVRGRTTSAGTLPTTWSTSSRPRSPGSRCSAASWPGS